MEQLRAAEFRARQMAAQQLSSEQRTSSTMGPQAGMQQPPTQVSTSQMCSPALPQTDKSESGMQVPFDLEHLALKCVQQVSQSAMSQIFMLLARDLN